MEKSALVLLTFSSILAAEIHRVPLEVRAGGAQSNFLSHALESDDSTHLHVTLPGGTTLQIERLPAPLPGIQITIPGGDPQRITLLPGQNSRVDLKRTVGVLDTVPYLIGYDRSEDHGNLHEDIQWIPAYRAEGRLQMPGCKVNIGVLDYNGDGKFDEQDSRQSTTLGLDLNGDGRFWGPGEWNFMAQMMTVCGKKLEVAELDPAGRFIVFKSSERLVPEVGKITPSFAVPMTNGSTLTAASLRGKVAVLDFWASWCAICVAKMGDVELLAKQTEGTARFFGINVDEPNAQAAAKRILAAKKISYPQVMQGLGDKDPLWRQFGSVRGNRLSTPLYVVIDQRGVIRYAGSGGENLSALKNALQKTLTDGSKDLRSNE
jgi:thiol-disulfide isomerase/thioredoxin